MKNINAPADLDEYEESVQYMKNYCSKYPMNVKRYIWGMITKNKFGDLPEGI